MKVCCKVNKICFPMVETGQDIDAFFQPKSIGLFYYSMPLLVSAGFYFPILIVPMYQLHTLESGINIPIRLLIFGYFSRDYILIKRLIFYYITLHILGGYVNSLCQFFQGLLLFKGIHLFRTLEYSVPKIVLTFDCLNRLFYSD